MRIWIQLILLCLTCILVGAQAGLSWAEHHPPPQPRVSVIIPTCEGYQALVTGSDDVHVIDQDGRECRAATY